MLLARAASRSFLTLGTVETQRGRTPQFTFMRSRIRSAVVLGSTVTGLSSGTGGAFTAVHSAVISLACAGRAASAAATMARTVGQQDRILRFFTMLPLNQKFISTRRHPSGSNLTLGTLA